MHLGTEGLISFFFYLHLALELNFGVLFFGFGWNANFVKTRESEMRFIGSQIMNFRLSNVKSFENLGGRMAYLFVRLTFIHSFQSTNKIERARTRLCCVFISFLSLYRVP